jgi:hypothetical protein
MNEKKVVPARGVMIALAVVLLVWALPELIFALAMPIELLSSSWPFSFVALEVEAVISALLALALFVVFGVRILTRVSRKSPAVNEVLTFGLFYSSLIFLHTVAVEVMDWILSVNNGLNVKWNFPLLILNNLSEIAIVVLFVIAVLLRKNSPKTALILGIVGAGLIALRTFVGFALDIAEMVAAGTTQGLWIAFDLLPLAASALMIVVLALTLSYEKKEAVAAPLASKNETASIH